MSTPAPCTAAPAPAGGAPAVRGRRHAAPFSEGLSVYLDFWRILAALAVFVLHASFHRFTGGLPGLWRLSVFGNDAVMVFFVLSGFVIAYVSARHEASPRAYLTARLARLWSICIPALALTVALDAIGMRLAPAQYAFDLYGYSQPLARLAASGLFLNELWFYSIAPFSNTPYWSVGYEFWYYVLFGATLFLTGGRRTITVALIALLIGPKILLLLPVWLAGVWALRTSLAPRLSVRAAQWLCVTTLAGYLAYRLLDGQAVLDALTVQLLGEAATVRLGWSEHFLSNYVVGALFALHFVGARRWLQARQAVPRWLRLPIRYLAGLSFALYLFHNPLLQFCAALVAWLDLRSHAQLVIVLVPLLVVLLIGHWAEQHKAPLRRVLLRSGAERPRLARPS